MYEPSRIRQTRPLMRVNGLLVVSMVLGVSGCAFGGGPTPPRRRVDAAAGGLDAAQGQDAGASGVDAGVELGPDAGYPSIDAGGLEVDSGFDAGPPPVDAAV